LRKLIAHLNRFRDEDWGALHALLAIYMALRRIRTAGEGKPRRTAA
jgi:hypothetical protein